jgi:glycosyltransferase involved in cell wall biosynthesis
MIQVSVVVPTYKRHELLERCLQALLAQDFDPAAYEVIIVDDAACDQARCLVEQWARRGRMQGVALCYLPVSGNHGPAAARNAGWHAAQGSIIAFTDDDCVPTENWLSAGVRAFKEGVVGVSGRVIVPRPPIPTDYQLNETGLERSEFVTANCFYRREVLAAVGGFDERFTLAWREDSDLFFTLLKRIGEDGSAPALPFVPEAVVVHPVRPARWGISLQQQRKNMFNALLYKKHPELYCQRVQPAPPWHYYQISLALLMMLIAIVRRRWWLALTSAGTWLGLTGYFCRERLKETLRTPDHVVEMAVTSALIPPLAIFWRIRGAFKFRVFFL